MRPCPPPEAAAQVPLKAGLSSLGLSRPALAPHLPSCSCVFPADPELRQLVHCLATSTGSPVLSSLAGSAPVPPPFSKTGQKTWR